MDLEAAKESIEDGRLIYTCKCGWIDTGHANPKSSRPYVGPDALWSQINSQSGRRPRHKDFGILPGRILQGFRVTYTQDAVQKIWKLRLYPGVTKHYLVAPGMSVTEKESVAMAIFQEVSRAFEKKQGLAFWSGSNFSVEDLVSNLLSFYTVVRPGKNYLNLCGPVTKADSLSLLEENPETFSTKNHVFKPKFYDCKACPGKGPFPLELQAINPSQKGVLFDDWLEMYDWEKGRPPLGSKL